MTRLLYFLPLLLCSSLLAAAYGLVHNQISYSVSPGYFHEFKFQQFMIDPSLQNRLGASLVGALASWWMGVLLGVPLYLLALLIRGNNEFWRAYVKAALIVVTVTLTVGLAALAVATMTVDAASLPIWMEGREASDPVAFARAGIMHNFSYIGGVIGAGVALGYMAVKVWLSRMEG